MQNIAEKYLRELDKYEKPNAKELIDIIFSSFVELNGDRIHGFDNSIISGIAMLNDTPVTVIGQLRGKNLEQQVKYNFSMMNPQGFRTVVRLIEQSEKFKRPVVCFVDTIGANPSLESESYGQASAISKCISKMLQVKVPVISILIGYGGSGGALALCVADRIFALEFSTLSVIAPRAYAEIVWKDIHREKEAFALLKMTSQDLMNYGIVDKIILEYSNGERIGKEALALSIKNHISTEINNLKRINVNRLVKERKNKYQYMGRKNR